MVTSPLLNGSFSGPKKQRNMEVLEVLMGKLPCKWWSFHSLAISGTDLLEVPTIYKAYLSGLCKGISPQNTALYGTVPPF